jgi:hypothetical protein
MFKNTTLHGRLVFVRLEYVQKRGKADEKAGRVTGITDPADPCASIL